MESRKTKKFKVNFSPINFHKDSTIPFCQRLNYHLARQGKEEEEGAGEEEDEGKGEDEEEGE